MATLHLFNIDKLKTDFQSLLHTQYEILKKKSLLTKKLQELKLIYNNLVKQNTKKIFLFCLDSFYFQYKTLIIEMDNISRYISLINNRMYGDYYKLFNIIIMQVSNSHLDTRTLVANFKKYTPYKDLEPFHEYKLSDIIQLHADIIRVINSLYAIFTSKEQNIHGYSDNTHVGISITSFLQTLEYENTLLREQIGLYVNYVTFFHASQNKYLTKLFQRIDSFQREIEEDILSNHGGTTPPPPPVGGVLSSMKISIHEGSSIADTALHQPEFEALLNLPSDETVDIETVLRETEELMQSSDIALDVTDLPTSPTAAKYFRANSLSKSGDGSVSDLDEKDMEIRGVESVSDDTTSHASSQENIVVQISNIEEGLEGQEEMHRAPLAIVPSEDDSVAMDEVAHEKCIHCTTTSS